MELNPPKGFRDLMPNEAIMAEEVISKIADTFRRFGFCTIDTPMLERLEILKAKNVIGEEGKLIYEIEGGELGLRYDKTVSLARFFANNRSLPLPFKRYSIGKSWRKEEPQKLRYREIMQADIDILGGENVYADAEIIAAGSSALKALGLNHVVHINDRRILDIAMSKAGIASDKRNAALHAIDKMDKIGKDGVEAMLQNEIGKESTGRLMALFSAGTSNEEKEGFVSSAIDETTGKQFGQLLDLLKEYHVDGKVEVDFTTVRGIDYYTSTAFEFWVKREDIKSAVGGGGRYDNLIGMYCGRSVNATGVALGVDRILDVLEFSNSKRFTYARCIVCTIKQSNFKYALKIAKKLRDSGINTELNVSNRNIANQLDYANALNIRFAIIVGDAEEKDENVKLKDLISGKESILNIEDAINVIG
ncbi:MAG: histidine--tRNA ligase [Candidatus Micrarchaeaceae archaeon]